MVARMIAVFFRTGSNPALRPKCEPAEGRAIAWIGHVEIRLTRPCVLVETLVKGVRREAQFKGLRRIQDYAGGKNRSHCKVRLADRVLVQEQGPALFRVRVRMAGGRQSGALPTPLDPKVKLVEARSEMLAVQHVPRRLTPKVIANAQSRLCLYLEGSQWIRVSAESLRLSESARTLPFRHYGELAFRVKEGPTAQGTTAALTI